MPTYEYRCKHCSHTMEEFQSMKDDPLVICPECKTPNLVRIIGNGSGLIFKGQGFYLTDYKKGSSQASTSSSPSSTSKSKDDAAPKSEASNKDSSASESKSADSAAKKSSDGGGSGSDSSASKGGSSQKSE